MFSSNKQILVKRVSSSASGEEMCLQMHTCLPWIKVKMCSNPNFTAVLLMNMFVGVFSPLMDKVRTDKWRALNPFSLFFPPCAFMQRLLISLIWAVCCHLLVKQATCHVCQIYPKTNPFCMYCVCIHNRGGLWWFLRGKKLWKGLFSEICYY